MSADEETRKPPRSHKIPYGHSSSMQRRTDLAKPYGDRLESIGSISHLTDSNTGFRLPVASEHHRLRASGARTRGECSQAARKTHSCVGAFCRCSCCLWPDSGFRPRTSPPRFPTLPRSACLGSVYPPWGRLLWSPIAKSRAPTGFRDGSGITMIGAIAVASEWDGHVLSSPLSEPSYWAASLPPDR